MFFFYLEMIYIYTEGGLAYMMDMRNSVDQLAYLSNFVYVFKRFANLE